MVFCVHFPFHQIAYNYNGDKKKEKEKAAVQNGNNWLQSTWLFFQNLANMTPNKSQ